ncbi:MAG: hypothetical protein UW27_C0002G0003 [Parcubacteria group bacterium GW2011_GWA1_44_13]|uniref:Uncharacterized protein n=1 Tax=Candidatus Nomurabacteria bacterium GW2011_GWB1_44_12 TaxID=1618748 RepID=A0A837I858_9BACT|nr:MAG: hypothetical protein UW17_C0004G0016 [Candidatus Nomurabacteria bacterium GW2011_GWD1_44_10]KKT37057.1 MAG: hypothetical protein UW25_C0002G0003 [Candidatus Nomurabacteria bacterium GW2011_GWB1_44_12]KKT38353.1 MAG: hypothetical protein UW27_C0002G0003 [Parcubacteria group bacterium GW2011_GWA1_44_13]
MCCFKRLAAKVKRKAGWARKQKAPAITRPSDTEIKLAKKKADRNNDRSKRRRIARDAKEEESRRAQFFQQNGWAT